MVVAALVVGTASCDKVPLLAPSESTITLSAGSLILPINGSTEISATVTEKPGTPVQDGTSVYFSTTLGTIVPAEARTENSRVTVRFNAGAQSGEAEITATSGASTLAQSVKIKVGSAAAGKVLLSANPLAIPASGGTSQLVATVLDTNSNPLAGVPVSFGTTAGTLDATMVVSDSSGYAQTTLRANSEATVTVTAGSQTASVTVKVSPPPSVSITVSSTGSAFVAGQTVSFSITASVQTGGATLRSMTLSFGDGASTSLGAVVGTTSAAHVYRSAGTYTATVTATDTTSQQATSSTVVVIGPAPTMIVTVTAGPTQTVGVGVTFTATVSASGTGTLPPIARYEWDFGDGTPIQSMNTGSTTHIYTTIGIRVVRVTAVATDGTAGTGQTEVSIR